MDRIAYINANQSAVLKPVIDRLVFTYKDPEKEFGSLLAEYALQEVEAGGEFYPASAFGTAAIKYKAAVNFTPPCGGSVLIQACPKSKKLKHDVRVEIKGMACCASGLASLKAKLEGLFKPVPWWEFTWSNFLKTSCVTAIDVAVDVVCLRLDEMDVHGPSLGGQGWWFS
jgi:hypothetical protein